MFTAGFAVVAPNNGVDAPFVAGDAEVGDGLKLNIGFCPVGAVFEESAGLSAGLGANGLGATLPPVWESVDPKLSVGVLEVFS